MPVRDLNGFDADSGPAVGLEVDTVDVEERLEDHSIELITEELEHLNNEQEKELADKI